VPTWRLTLEYDGTRYRGWQVQPGERTVAGAVLQALEAAGLRGAELGGAGRTDAGVHALAQVAHVRLPRRVETPVLREALDAELPHDVAAVAVAPAPDSFHARHDAAARAYVYQVCRRRTALAKRHVWWVRQPLDVAALRRGAARLAGRHDFHAFTERPWEQGSTVVVVERVEVVESGALVLVRMVASHFLWRLVRRCVGALVQVGSGALSPDDLDAALRAPPRAPGEEGLARFTAPASGLFLERVVYPGEPPLGALVAPVPVGAAPECREKRGRSPY
jgi:tRNA pseudouridine38-40 synthase